MAGRILHRDAASGRVLPSHRHTGSDTYHSWEAMVQRCCNSSHVSYPNYGGRGVKVCDRWKDSFAAFLEDVGERPSRRHSLDRFPDQNGHYEPGNVRWATQKDQHRNKRSNVVLTLNGESHCIAEWAEILGVPRHRLYFRLKNGMPVARVLDPRNYKTLPVKQRHPE